MATVNFLEPFGRPWRECRPRNDPSRVFELDLDAYGPRDIAGRRHAIKLYAMYVTGISRETLEQRFAKAIEDAHQWLAKDKLLSISHEAFELVVDLGFWWQFFRSVEEERRPRCPYIPQVEMINGSASPLSASYTAWIDQRVDQLPWVRQKRDQQAARTAAAAAAVASSSKKDGSPAPVQEVKNSEIRKASQASEAKGKGKAVAADLESSRRATSVAPGTFAPSGTAGASGEASSSQEASAAAEGTERYLKAAALAQEQAKEIIHLSEGILEMVHAQMSSESATPLFSWKKESGSDLS